MNGELQLADTANLFLIGTDPKRERVTISPTGGVISAAESLNMAAWIVALIDPDRKRFDALVEAIKRS